MGLSKPPRDASPVRTFLAVELPGTERSALARLERAFSQNASVLKWTAPDLLHITVRFLGNVDVSRMEAVEAAARRGASQVQPFALRLSGLGAFPNERSPRVIWVGLAHDAGYLALERLFQLVEEGLVDEGFEREGRAFSPHITLARTRDHISAGDRRALAGTLTHLRSINDMSSTFSVRHLTVMRSDLSKAGPRYSALATVPLGEQE